MSASVGAAPPGAAPPDPAAGNPGEGAGTDLFTSLRVAVLRMNRRLRNEQGQATATQLSALHTLSRCGPLTPTMLAVLEHVQPPSMTRVIAALESRALVTRSPHPEDRRQALIELTAEGRRLVELDVRGADDRLASAFERLTPGEQQALRDALPAIERLATG